jgi:hypothetical protein
MLQRVDFSLCKALAIVVMATTGAIACAPIEADAPDEALGVAQDAFLPQTSVRSVLLGPLMFLRASGGIGSTEESSAVAAAYSTSLGAQYFVLYRTHDSPYTLNYVRVDGKAASPTFGQKTQGPSATSCVGGCQGRDPDGTSWYESSILRRAVFVYGAVPFNVPQQIGAFSKVEAVKFGANGTQAKDVVALCFDEAGAPTCRVMNMNAASSERKDGTDRVLVPYLEGDKAIDAWRLAARLYNPGNGTSIQLPYVQPCEQPTGCDVASVYAPALEVAYNRLADKFLVVSAIWSFSAHPRIRGQIYDGQSGTLGPTIDFGIPATPANAYVGVASSPIATANPNHEWVVFVDRTRYSVLPNGTFTSAPISPVHDCPGQWTLNWTDTTSDVYHYERLVDWADPQAVSSTRYPSTFAPAGTEYALEAAENEGYAEGLAHDLTSNNSIATWSRWTCGVSGCSPELRWRIIDQ